MKDEILKTELIENGKSLYLIVQLNMFSKS